MAAFRSQLEELDGHVKAFLATPSSSVGRSCPCPDWPLSLVFCCLVNVSSFSSDVVTTVRSQYQPFLLLAAQLQAVHSKIQHLRELYLGLRRVVLNDWTDVFAQLKDKDKPGDKLYECACVCVTSALVDIL